MPRGSTVLNQWATNDAPSGQAATFGEGDILFGKLRPYFRKVGVAPIIGRCSTEILVLRPVDPELYGVLLGHVASQKFIDHCTTVSRGTKMPRAEWRDAGTFRIAVPPVAVARKFSDLTRDAYARIKGMIFELRTLREIRDALLPRLISGEILVPDTNDPEEVIGPAAEELTAATR
jgi:type I restriction enzyme S subunit